MRADGWERRLHDYLAGLADIRFGYDHARRPRHLDCCIFAADGVVAMTGDDPMADLRGRYTSRRSAQALIATIGGSIEAVLDARFGQVPIGFARRGDLVMHDGSVGICVGADALFVDGARHARGLVRIPRAGWTHAWAID